jgi:hypothetical protein
MQHVDVAHVDIGQCQGCHALPVQIFPKEQLQSEGHAGTVPQVPSADEEIPKPGGRSGVGSRATACKQFDYEIIE